MRSSAASSSLPSRLWRGVALLAAVLVLLLSVSSVSPALHAWLHDLGHDHAEHTCPHHGARAATSDSAPAPDGEDHQCAVTLFAHGHLLAALFVALLLFIGATWIIPVFPTRLLALASIDYAWPHGCGPPAA